MVRDGVAPTALRPGSAPRSWGGCSMSKILCVARGASSIAFFGTLTLLGLLWSGSAAADQCKPAGATCNSSQSCCGSGGRTKGVCVKAPGAKFGVCCSSTATTEVCDGRDNNCNGQIDENLGSTTCGNGTCAHTVQNCVGGVAQTCDPGATDGNGCADGNGCTENDVCEGGQCQGDPIHCTPSDDCHVAGQCDPSTGLCSTPPAGDGTACDDGDACTQNDRCQAGVCSGSGGVLCPPNPVECQVTSCVSPTGCESANAPDGTPCGPTLSRTCRAGVCQCLPLNADCDTLDREACCSLQCCPTTALGGSPGRCCETR